jgi:pyridoxine kinase
LRPSECTVSSLSRLTPDTSRRLLSETRIHNVASLTQAIEVLHQKYQIPHIVVTSVTLPTSASPDNSTLSIFGSSIIPTSSGNSFSDTKRARIFQIVIPSLDCFFSGTGDMFAALTTIRLREEIDKNGLSGVKSWLSPPEVQATDLPLARAVERVLGSMQTVLTRTMEKRAELIAKEDEDFDGERLAGEGGEDDEEDAEEKKAREEVEKRRYIRRTKAAELKLVRHLDALRNPQVQHHAQKVDH